MAPQPVTGFMLQDLMWHWNKKGSVSTDTSWLVATKPLWTMLVWVGYRENTAHFSCILLCGSAHFIMVFWNFPSAIFWAGMADNFLWKFYSVYLFPSLESLYWPQKVILCLFPTLTWLLHDSPACTLHGLQPAHCMALQHCTSLPCYFFSIMPHKRP